MFSISSLSYPCDFPFSFRHSARILFNSYFDSDSYRFLDSPVSIISDPWQFLFNFYVLLSTCYEFVILTCPVEGMVLSITILLGIVETEL
jgi:hypothetical protein